MSLFVGGLNVGSLGMLMILAALRGGALLPTTTREGTTAAAAAEDAVVVAAVEEEEEEKGTLICDMPLLFDDNATATAVALLTRGAEEGGRAGAAPTTESIEIKCFSDSCSESSSASSERFPMSNESIG